MLLILVRVRNQRKTVVGILAHVWPRTEGGQRAGAVGSLTAVSCGCLHAQLDLGLTGPGMEHRLPFIEDTRAALGGNETKMIRSAWSLYITENPVVPKYDVDELAS